MSKRIALLLFLISLTVYNSLGFAADFGFKPGELIVCFKPKANGQKRTISERNAVLASIDGGSVKHCYKLVPGLTLVILPPRLSIENAITAFQKSGEILYAEPNYYIRLALIPDDPQFYNLWGMHNDGGGGRTLDADIDAPEAWNIQTDASDIIVAVIDTGIAYDHPDLEDNIWINPGEIPDNGIDDDNNNYIDDVHGYDFRNGDSDPYDDGNPADRAYGHGTHIAGTIGAVGDNDEGVVGVCWNVKIMALKAFNSDDSGTTDQAIQCINYASDMGAKVLNCSWGGPDFHLGLSAAIAAAGANGVLCVAAAHNQGRDIDIFQQEIYPARYDLDNIISVMATDWDDERSVWSEESSSNWGAVSVDLAAPGSIILSCWPGGGYQYGNGTSMATPHVAGACALAWAANPSLSHLEVKGIILNTVDVKAQLVDDPQLGRLCVTGGRLNLNNAVREAVEFPTDDELVGSWRLNEGEGTIAYDSAGDNDGTLGGAPFDPAWHNDTRHGWCLDFDMDNGQEDKVSLSPIVALMTDSVTISAWIRTGDALTQKIFTQYDGFHGYRLYLSANFPMGVLPRFRLLNFSAVADNVTVNQWCHLAGTYDGETLRIYVDGVEEDTVPCPGQKGFYGDAYIGHDDVLNNHFIGQIDDVRVYNYALDLFGIWDAMTGDLPRFRINNSEDETVAWFDSLGNIFLEGGLEEGKGEDPTREYDDGFKFTNSSGDTVLAIIDETNGNMYIRGYLYTEQGMLYPAGFKVINMYGGSYIDNSDDYLGYLVMTGKLYELNPLP